MYFQFVFFRLKSDAQTGGRWLVRGFARTEQHDEGAARFGRDGEPAQLLVAGMAEPSDEAMAGTGAQHLLRRPERVTPAGCAHHGEVGEIDPRGGQGRRVRQMRRRQPDDALARGSKSRQRRQHELQLADSLLETEDLGQRPRRPAAPRQFPVEVDITRGNRWGNRRERRAAPDRMLLQESFQGRHLG